MQKRPSEKIIDRSREVEQLLQEERYRDIRQQLVALINSCLCTDSSERPAFCPVSADDPDRQRVFHSTEYF